MAGMYIDQQGTAARIQTQKRYMQKMKTETDDVGRTIEVLSELSHKGLGEPKPAWRLPQMKRAVPPVTGELK